MVTARSPYSFIALTCAAVLLAGCMSSVRVYRSDSLAAKPRGIPFYVKTAVCRQETIWLEPQYVLRYEVSGGTSAYGPVQKVLSRKEYMQKSVQEFIARPDALRWKSDIFDLPGPASFNEGDSSRLQAEEAEGNWVRASNTGAVEAVVDYGSVFYLNSARPLAGSTQVNAKLAADGTLTEASAQLQDQTLSTIASTITSLVGSASTASKMLGAVASSEGKLMVTTSIYKHSHMQYAGNPAGPARAASCTAVPQGVLGGSFTVTDVSPGAAAGPKSAGADKDNTINVTGTIVLPKAAVTPTK